MKMIFAIHEPHTRRERPVDLEPLKAAGEHSFIFPQTYSPSYDPAAARDHAMEELADFDFDRDSLCWIGGDPIAPVVVTSALAEMARDQGRRGLTWLRYERSKNGRPSRYSPVVVPI